MTSRQRVLRTLEFDHPDRVPRDLWVLRIAVHDHGREAIDSFRKRWPGDIGRPAARMPRSRLAQGDPYAIGHHRDEWGCVFEQIKAGVIGEVKEPILGDVHSDGHIAEVYEDLIEIGVDAVNSQLFCMNIEDLGRRCKGRITFWGEIDRQHLLPYGTEAEVRAAVKRVIDNLWSPAGGVIAQFELSAGSKLVNGETVFETWRELTG